ncbi:MAG: hypothetical protein LIO91_10365, partial [Bacteroidales bacterium]|nr:hypothetical protein [Bacteroidales bacterium]
FAPLTPETRDAYLEQVFAPRYASTIEGVCISMVISPQEFRAHFEAVIDKWILSGEPEDHKSNQQRTKHAIESVRYIVQDERRERNRERREEELHKTKTQRIQNGTTPRTGDTDSQRRLDERLAYIQSQLNHPRGD